MGNPRRGFPTEKQSADCFSPLLRYLGKEILRSADRKAGLCPFTPPPFEKGGRKPLVFC